MENVCPEGTEDQYVTSKSGEAWGVNVYVRCSERIRKYPQRYEPEFGGAREWKSDTVASLGYIIRDGYCDSNIYADKIL